jgi:hypothetical protein
MSDELKQKERLTKKRLAEVEEKTKVSNIVPKINAQAFKRRTLAQLNVYLGVINDDSY